ncbi:MAG: STAS/SEC14 domain-containing protein [Chloroflexota bacterium]
MELSQDKFSLISVDEETDVLILTWTPATSNMTDEDFKAVNLAYANFAEEHKTQKLLIDVRQFGHQFGPELGGWRMEHIIPKYHNAGVQKMAFLHGPDFDESAPGMPTEGENFVTRHFASQEHANAWLEA